MKQLLLLKIIIIIIFIIILFHNTFSKSGRNSQAGPAVGSTLSILRQRDANSRLHTTARVVPQSNTSVHG